MYVCIWLCWVLVAVHRIFNLGYGLKDLFFSCGIQFPDQGSTPGPLHWKHSLSHWTTRENPGLFFLCIHGQGPQRWAGQLQKFPSAGFSWKLPETRGHSDPTKTGRASVAEPPAENKTPRQDPLPLTRVSWPQFPHLQPKGRMPRLSLGVRLVTSPSEGCGL